MTAAQSGATEPVRIEKLVAGGAGLARHADGRILFVAGALPGELVRVGELQERKDFAGTEVVDVLEPSEDRVEPPCPHIARGCGGCDLQYADPSRQPDLKRDVVVDALGRIGRLTEPTVEVGSVGPSTGYRTTVRCIVDGGRAGFRRQKTHDVVAVDSCGIAHPGIQELLAEGMFGAAEEVTLRIGARTGERLVFAGPTAEGVVLPEDVLVVAADGRSAGATAAIHEQAAGRTWRVSARSFFQASAWGADTLAELVIAEVTAGGGGVPDTVTDLYAGVGLFAGALATELRSRGEPVPRLTVVESSRSSIGDARHNLIDISDARVTRRRVETWKPAPADVVIADPARRGLAREGVGAIAATGCGRLVLVSCDAASLGRDTHLLGEEGYRHVRSTIVDLFPQTSHVEVVTCFELGTPPGT